MIFTGMLPLALNPDATFFNSERTGVFFLRTYGWFVDPFGDIRGTPTSMPATLVADSWRRFGWIGVTIFFFVWGWALGKGTMLLRFGPDRLGYAIYSTALMGDILQDYTNDVTYLIDSLPRRLLVIGVYTVLMLSLRKIRTYPLARRQSPGISAAVRPPSGVAPPLG